MQFLQFVAAFAACFLALMAVLAVPGPRGPRPGPLSMRPPRHVGRHDARRPRLPLRPAEGSERARLRLDRDRLPGWGLTGAEGLARDEVPAEPKDGHQRRDEHQ